MVKNSLVKKLVLPLAAGAVLALSGCASGGYSVNLQGIDLQKGPAYVQNEGPTTDAHIDNSSSWYCAEHPLICLVNAAAVGFVGYQMIKINNNNTTTAPVGGGGGGGGPM